MKVELSKSELDQISRNILEKVAKGKAGDQAFRCIEDAVKKSIDIHKVWASQNAAFDSVKEYLQQTLGRQIEEAAKKSVRECIDSENMKLYVRSYCAEILNKKLYPEDEE